MLSLISLLPLGIRHLYLIFFGILFFLEETLQKKINEKEGLEKILKKLEIRATFSGKIYFSDNFREKQCKNWDRDNLYR